MRRIEDDLLQGNDLYQVQTVLNNIVTELEMARASVYCGTIEDRLDRIELALLALAYHTANVFTDKEGQP